MNTLERIIILKNQQNLSDKVFEQQLKLMPKTVDSWKRGNSEAYYKLLPQIAKYFNVSADYLLGLTEDKTVYY